MSEGSRGRETCEGVERGGRDRERGEGVPAERKRARETRKGSATADAETAGAPRVDLAWVDAADPPANEQRLTAASKSTPTSSPAQFPVAPGPNPPALLLPEE